MNVLCRIKIYKANVTLTNRGLSYTCRIAVSLFTIAFLFTIKCRGKTTMTLALIHCGCLYFRRGHKNLSGR